MVDDLYFPDLSFDDNDQIAQSKAQGFYRKKALCYYFTGSVHLGYFSNNDFA